RKESVFRCFAEACEGLPVQLVITHGGGLDERAVASFPGKPLVVSYAPQMAVLAKTCLALTHAGLNTVLDSLANGVPLIAVPITYEQPAIASRIRWSGTGCVIRLSKLSVRKLREAVQTVLSDASYTDKAQAVKCSIQRGGGAMRAADIVEQG